MHYYLIVLASFTSFLFFYAILQLVFFSNKRLNKRMKYYLSMSDKPKLDKRKFNLILQIQLYKQRLGSKVSKGKSKKLENILRRAGIPLKPEEFILFRWISTALGAALFYLISGKIFFLVLGLVIGYTFPMMWMKRKEKQRIQKFNDGLADMITTIVGSLRAGFSFPQALKTVVEEADGPIKDEIGHLLKDMQYGSTLEDSLNELHERMPSEDLELMIQAILIQRQVGGNLASVLDKIVQTIRDRTKIQRQIKTLTAQGKLSGIVIGLLPIILGIILYLIEPEYIGSLFTNPIGMALLGASLVSGIIGLILIRKMTTIEV
ncbi:type II secretion system F family protein [Alkalihalobacillus sp. AL-G]|uniref:type II secretion system F family protein n=1 Tax=Alkalihalobacillus sp. AL-G TaxID=2926399 RepID=UPI00272C9DC3|nr:type II secretion system F family protein [Alkalihalobacillus sp. AL-G]WLD93944.1 type II secretion system F family protein [Alkalihalobacillus sp. AL-G]